MCLFIISITRKMLRNKETLKKVKPGCVLINTARGQLVDTNALIEALKNGIVAGAGLDLIENVPPLDTEHPLLKLGNVIITTYYGWYTEDSGIVLREIVANEIRRVLTGSYPIRLKRGLFKGDAVFSDKILASGFGIKELKHFGPGLEDTTI